MLNIEISDEQLQEAITLSMNKLFKEDNYSNPLAKLIEKAVGSSYSRGTLTEQIETKIVSKINQFMETSDFDIMLGQAVAKAIADREVKKKKR